MVILLVEDEPKQSEFIQRTLERASFTVDAAFDGEEGKQKLEVRDYDLMIIDLDLPKIHGSDLVKHARDMGLKTPILILTANDALQAKVSHLDLGADDYLTKPFALEELLARVRALLRRPESVLPHIFKRGGLEIHFGTREVKLYGKTIKLTRNEFRLLNLLARKSERICTRGMIEEHIWGYEQIRQSNVVEALVYSVRRKLGKEHKDFIQTVQNIGYRLKPQTD